MTSCGQATGLGYFLPGQRPMGHASLADTCSKILNYPCAILLL